MDAASGSWLRARSWLIITQVGGFRPTRGLHTLNENPMVLECEKKDIVVYKESLCQRLHKD